MDSVQQTSSAAFFNTLLHYRAPAYSPIPPLLSLPITLPYSLKATQNPSPAPEQGHIQVQGESAWRQDYNFIKSEDEAHQIPLENYTRNW